MDLTTFIIIIAVIALVMAFLNRNRAMSRGGYNNDLYNRGGARPTYDDPNYRSGGSIGGEPDTLQERSVGGSERNSPTYDDPNYRSGGSIGG